MWVSTSFSSVLNFLPHQVRSAFQLSICPPSSRMKRKFPCCAHGGTSSGLARYSLGAGSKDCAEQREAATKPISPMFLAIRIGRRVSCLTDFKPSSFVIIIIRLFFPFWQMRRRSKTSLKRAGLSQRETLGDYRCCCCESATKDALGADGLTRASDRRNSSGPSKLVVASA